MNIETVKNIVASDSGFWSGPRTRMLEAIAPLLHGTRVDSEQLARVEDALKEEYRTLPRIKKTRLALILEELCNNGTLEWSDLPVVPTRVPRPSILPSSPQAFRLLASFELMHDFLWTHWLTEARPTSDRCLALMIVLGVEMGIAGGAWIRTLSRLTWQDVTGDDRIVFPVHWLDTSDRHAIFHITPSLRVLLDHVRAGEPGAKPDDPVLLPQYRGLKVRIRELESSLEAAYDRFITEVKKKHPGLIWPDWQQFGQYAPLIALYAGIDQPCLLSAMRQAPLPSSASPRLGVPLLAIERSPVAGIILSVTPGKRARLRNNTTWQSVPVETAPEDDVDDDNDWCGTALQMLRQLNAEIDSTLKRRATARKAEELRPIFERYRHRADSVAPPQSALHLAIDWAEYKLIEQRGLKPKSLRKYLRLTMEEGFLTDPKSRDLSTWGREDHEQLVDHLLEIRRALATTAFLLDKLGQLYRFAMARGYCDEAPSIPHLGSWVGGSGRPWMVGLHQFDAFVRLLFESGSREDRFLAVVAILGFYAGLRADEVVSLTLNEVLIADGELWIWVWRGKSTAARRAIPLHLLAPDSAISVVTAWVAERHGEFREDAILSRVGLFGPEKDRARYDYNSLIGNLIDRLKDSFGDGADFHLLRHSFASWMFLRWYATRYDDFAATLTEGHHSLFTPAAMRKLTHFFTLGRHNHMPHYSPSDLIMVSKLIGHSGLNTFFATYLHSYDAVQRHVMRRLTARFGERVLPGKTIATLFPALRSRTSQSRLASRTVNGLVNRAGKQPVSDYSTDRQG
jgi:integrase